MDPNDLLAMAWKWQRSDVALNTGGDLSAALGRITAKTFVMPIDEYMFFPPRDCKAEQELISGSELRVVEDIAGHLSLFATVPTYMPQIDQHLGDLPATEVRYQVRLQDRALWLWAHAGLCRALLLRHSREAWPRESGERECTHSPRRRLKHAGVAIHADPV